MSILDRSPVHSDNLNKLLEAGGPKIKKILKETGLDKDPIVKGIMEGLTKKEILRIPDKTMNNIFCYGARFLEAGEIDKASVIFNELYRLDPMENSYLYAMATTYQMKKDFETAAHLYLQFLAMDATNAQGYLRLGECLLAVGETENAKEFFMKTIREVDRSNGVEEDKKLAEDLLAKIEEQHVEEET